MKSATGYDSGNIPCRQGDTRGVQHLFCILKAYGGNNPVATHVTQVYQEFARLDMKICFDVEATPNILT
jgi:hypothetical protein